MYDMLLVVSWSWCQAAIDRGVGHAYGNLGLLYRDADDESGRQDVAKALSLFREGVARGNAWSAVCLAYSYLRGLGVDKDVKRAIELYEMAVREQQSQEERAAGGDRMKWWCTCLLHLLD